MTQASRDENRIPTLLGVSSADGTTPVTLFADPTTHRLYVDLAAGGTTTVDAGTTTTLAPGASATVVNSGTTTDALFDFGIPAGEKGDPGDTGPTGPVGMVWKDAYVGATAYVVNDAVSYNGSSYICILNSTGNLPTDTTYWSLVAQKGSDGLGTGDMLASVYDPTNVAGDAFDMDNMVEGTNNKLVSAAEKSGWSGKQDALGFTPEDIANKSTNIITDAASNTKYPGVKAIKDYADGLVAGLLDYRGGYDASSGDYPITGGSGTAGAVMKGDMWVVSVAGTIGGEDIQVGDSIIANIDTPGQTASNWNHLNANISYVPENVANKKIDLSDNSDSYYPSQKAVKTAVDAKVDKSLFDANTILYATTDDTPVALTISEQTIVGRKTGGNIEALAIDSDLSSVSANDDTVPSAKATKAALDSKAPTASPTFTGTVTLADNARIDLTLPTADTYVTGNTTDSFASGYSSAVGDLVFFGSGGKWLEVDADAVATCKGMMGIALESKTDGQAMLVALPGSFVRLDSWNWTVGDTLYAGETLGAIQNTIPTGADAIIRVIGFAVSADVIYFMPSSDQQSTVA